VSATLAEKLAVDLRQGGADTPLYELLSDREFQVLRMIASGKTVKDIAEDLSLSVKTVSTYRGRILEKTGMKTNAELIRYALEISASRLVVLSQLQTGHSLHVGYPLAMRRFI